MVKILVLVGKSKIIKEWSRKKTLENIDLINFSNIARVDTNSEKINTSLKQKHPVVIN